MRKYFRLDRRAMVKDKARLPDRLMSLDVFRGATIAAMILVNNAGDEPSSYRVLRHSVWNGWTPTDLVFPFFLFIGGVAVAFSVGSRLKRGNSRKTLLLHVIWRGLVLFAMGMFLNGFPDHYQLATWRVYGVLQRIAICYVVSTLVELWLGWRGHVAVIFVCLAGYWVLMRYVPIPGFGIPGKDIPFLDPDKNLAAWLDRRLLSGHLYEVTRDPEGVLSTMPAIATALLGLLTGKWLRSSKSAGVKTAGLFFSGFFVVILGEIWSHWFPINKKLWTSSYVLLTAGLALLILVSLYQVVDVKQWRGRWTTPFLVFGLNSIAAYVFSELMPGVLDQFSVNSDGGRVLLRQAIYERLLILFASPSSASLLYALAYTLLCWLGMLILYRKTIFVKI